ncbi:hypothetical protein DFJ73DRAFT_964275 [Zopfochytrium polystomum]|nr:hypothetical protein DFJ73DRAFT_964275 [Zopfochytrium polystomum]
MSATRPPTSLAIPGHVSRLAQMVAVSAAAAAAAAPQKASASPRTSGTGTTAAMAESGALLQPAGRVSSTSPPLDGRRADSVGTVPVSASMAAALGGNRSGRVLTWDKKGFLAGSGRPAGPGAAMSASAAVSMRRADSAGQQTRAPDGVAAAAGAGQSMWVGSTGSMSEPGSSAPTSRLTSRASTPALSATSYSSHSVPSSSPSPLPPPSSFGGASGGAAMAVAGVAASGGVPGWAVAGGGSGGGGGVSSNSASSGKPFRPADRQTDSATHYAIRNEHSEERKLLAVAVAVASVRPVAAVVAIVAIAVVKAVAAATHHPSSYPPPAVGRYLTSTSFFLLDGRRGHRLVVGLLVVVVVNLFVHVHIFPPATTTTTATTGIHGAVVLIDSIGIRIDGVPRNGNRAGIATALAGARAQMQRTTSFSTLEGVYALRDEIKYELQAHPAIGTSLSFVTIKSNEPPTKRSSMELTHQHHHATAASGSAGASSSAAASSGGGGGGSGGATGSAASGGASQNESGTPVSAGSSIASAGFAAFSSIASSIVSQGGDAADSDKGSTTGTSLFSSAKSKQWQKKPSSIGKPTSTFVSKIVAHEQLAKFLTYRPAETSYVFFNIGRSFIWADYFFQTKEPLTAIHFKEAYITCHDVNLLTRDNMDTVLGFTSGDVICYSPISGKYVRLNKNGVINKTGVTCIKWMPGSENLFMVGFEDSQLVIFDKEKEDQAFTLPPQSESDSKPIHFHKPPKPAKSNPISVWHIPQARSITALSFSPDCQHVAITSQDGKLRVVDYVAEKLWDTYGSYFGGVGCVAWSPDGKFMLTGGQDDLVTIWGFRGKIVARCQGHMSWVTAVAFDPYNCTERSYRFGSVSEDTRLCLWDFSVSSLHRPKTFGAFRKARGDGDKPGQGAIEHPVLPKNEVAMLEPFMIRSVHGEPLAHLAFREDAVITADRAGTIKIWSRPKPVAAVAVSPAGSPSAAEGSAGTAAAAAGGGGGGGGGVGGSPAGSAGTLTTTADASVQRGGGGATAAGAGAGAARGSGTAVGGSVAGTGR